MAHKWLMFVTVFIIIQQIDARKPPVRQEAPHQATVRVPLSKPVGITRPKLGKNLEERRLGQDYIEQYQEMIKASQESFENFDERDDKRLRRLIGDDLELMAEASGVGDRRRRSGGRLPEHSAVGRRRARSQAIRRDKLNAQGATSHNRHSRPKYIHYGDN